MTVGEKIRYYRKQRGLSQKALGELAGGIHEVTIRKYETGLRHPKPDRLQQIADALEVSVYVFLDVEIRTISDVLALLFDMDEHAEIHIESSRDADGEIDPDSITLRIDNDEINERIALWLKTQDVLEKLKDSQDNFASRRDYEQAVANMKKKTEDIRSRLLQDATLLD